MSRSHEEMAVVMRSIADQVTALVEEHERQYHEGEPCPGERLGAVAYIAHCIGIRSDSPSLFAALNHYLQAYEEVCPDCQHRRLKARR